MMLLPPPSIRSVDELAAGAVAVADNNNEQHEPLRRRRPHPSRYRAGE
jgi:hypothetical protein